MLEKNGDTAFLLIYLFVDSEGPASNILEMVVGHMFHCEYLTILFGTCVFWPK